MAWWCQSSVPNKIDFQLLIARVPYPSVNRVITRTWSVHFRSSASRFKGICALKVVPRVRRESSGNSRIAAGSMNNSVYRVVKEHRRLSASSHTLLLESCLWSGFRKLLTLKCPEMWIRFRKTCTQIKVAFGKALKVRKTTKSSDFIDSLPINTGCECPVWQWLVLFPEQCFVPVVAQWLNSCVTNIGWGIHHVDSKFVK